MPENDLSTEVELLKREVKSMNVIHGRLDTAIEKLTEVSNCINRMLAVHEERYLNKKRCRLEMPQNLQMM